LFAASLSPTVTGLLDTLLTHVSSDGVKLRWPVGVEGEMLSLVEEKVESFYILLGMV
jgi:hypothetical protein